MHIEYLEHDFISLNIIYRSYPNISDTFDKNWLYVNANIV